MAYEFKTLGSVEALTEVPENAHALVEVDGAIKRVPGGALGGSAGGGDAWDFMIVDDSTSLGGGIEQADASSFSFAKGDAESLWTMLKSGQAPKVCFYTLYTPSYGDPMFACSIPTRIVTGTGSECRFVKFDFIEYSDNGYITSVTIPLYIYSDNINFEKRINIGGEPN